MLKNLYYKSSAVITVLALTSTKSEAAADLGETMDTATSNINAAIGLLNIVAYVAGIGFGIAGILKLKEYMDKPGQGIGLKEPMGRLLVGAFLIALPTILGLVIASSTGDDTTIARGEFG